MREYCESEDQPRSVMKHRKLNRRELADFMALHACDLKVEAYSRRGVSRCGGLLGFVEGQIMPSVARAAAARTYRPDRNAIERMIVS